MNTIYTRFIGVRLTPRERETLRSLVERDRTTTSEFIRHLIAREATSAPHSSG